MGYLAVIKADLQYQKDSFHDSLTSVRLVRAEVTRRLPDDEFERIHLPGWRTCGLCVEAVEDDAFMGQPVNVGCGDLRISMEADVIPALLR